MGGSAAVATSTRARRRSTAKSGAALPLDASVPVILAISKVTISALYVGYGVIASAAKRRPMFRDRF